MGLFSVFRKGNKESAPGQEAPARQRAKRKSAATENEDVPEQKRARRRLIGAVVLMLIIVFALPVLFDPEPPTRVNDITIQIPSRDMAARTAPVLVEEEEVLVEPSAPVATQQPASQLAQAPASETSVSVPVAIPAPAVPQPVITEPAPAPQAAKPEPAISETERALAILEGRTAPAKPPVEKKPVTNGKFTIQVAALATQEKINELRKKLSNAGITSYTQKVHTADGERTRIRVGPFASKQEAEKMQARIKKLGLNATMVPV